MKEKKSTINCIIYNKAGKIFRAIQCSPAMSKIQAKENEFMMEGIANDATQKIKFDGFDVDGQPINPRVVDKTPEEIEADNPLELPVGQQLAQITIEQWQDVLKKLDKLGEN